MSSNNQDIFINLRQITFETVETWHASPPHQLGGIKNFRKEFAWTELFILVGVGVGVISLGEGGHGIWKELKISLEILINMFYQVYHIKIFSFSFLYFSSIANVIAVSIMYVKHPKEHNNQQFNVKAILKKKKIESMIILE